MWYTERTTCDAEIAAFEARWKRTIQNTQNSPLQVWKLHRKIPTLRVRNPRTDRFKGPTSCVHHNQTVYSVNKERNRNNQYFEGVHEPFYWVWETYVIHTFRGALVWLKGLSSHPHAMCRLSQYTQGKVRTGKCCDVLYQEWAPRVAASNKKDDSVDESV